MRRRTPVDEVTASLRTHHFKEIKLHLKSKDLLKTIRFALEEEMHKGWEPLNVLNFETMNYVLIYFKRPCGGRLSCTDCAEEELKRGENRKNV